MQKKSQFRNLILVLIVNAVILGYIEFGITDDERYQSGIEAYQEGNYYKTFNLMTRLAENDNVDAQSMLASLYLKGQGVDADKEQALFWYEKAAKQGNTEALAFMKQHESTIK